MEVSVDQITWHLVADKTREACRSWQVITFDKQPVTFVKIVGTHNTANEVGASSYLVMYISLIYINKTL